MFLFHFAGDLRWVTSVFLAALAFPFRVRKAAEAVGEECAVGISLAAGEKNNKGFAASSAAAAATGDGVRVGVVAMVWAKVKCHAIVGCFGEDCAFKVRHRGLCVTVAGSRL
jgi:hypothetical protein